MGKTVSIITAIVVTSVFFLWYGGEASDSYLETIGSLRGSIIEARSLLKGSPSKDDIEYARVILENAQNSLERDREN